MLVFEYLFLYIYDVYIDILAICKCNVFRKQAIMRAGIIAYDENLKLQDQI